MTTGVCTPYKRMLFVLLLFSRTAEHRYRIHYTNYCRPNLGGKKYFYNSEIWPRNLKIICDTSRQAVEWISYRIDSIRKCSQFGQSWYFGERRKGRRAREREKERERDKKKKLDNENQKNKETVQQILKWKILKKIDLRTLIQTSLND